MPDPGADSILRRARQGAYRALILDAAEPLFAEHGYEAAKVTGHRAPRSRGGRAAAPDLRLEVLHRPERHGVTLSDAARLVTYPHPCPSGWYRVVDAVDVLHGKPLPMTALGEELAGTWIAPWRQDPEVWDNEVRDNEVYHHKPAVVRGDGPIHRLRTWHRQLYPTEVTP